MSEIIGSVIEKLPVSPEEAPQQGVNRTEQPKIETVEVNKADDIGKSVVSTAMVKDSAPVVREDNKWDGHGYKPVISTENTSGDRAMEIVLQKLNREPVSYVG